MRHIFLQKGRQLFVDDFLINKTNLERTFHVPEPYKFNPVLEPKEEWEKTGIGALYAAPFSDGVWYDESERGFKMWYMAGAGNQYPSLENAFYTCYAESDDGIHWKKEFRDVIPDTNVVDCTIRDAATIWLDKMDRQPNKRYKMFLTNRRSEGKDSRLMLKYSSDGIHWSPPKAISGKIRDRFSAYFDPFQSRWVVSLRHETSDAIKTRTYATNVDPEKLVEGIGKSEEKFWFGPDGTEPRHPRFPEIHPGIYNFDVIAYESIYLGYYTIWQGPTNEMAEELGIHKRNEVILGFSRDGNSFSKTDHPVFFGVDETPGSWNYGNVQSYNGSPIVVGDFLYFYFSGRRRNDIMWDSHMSTGLARLRRDGFVSLRAEKEDGFLITNLFDFTGEFLFVNANMSKGILKVEVLNDQLEVIPGFSKDDCLPMCKNDTKYRIRWETKESLLSIASKSIVLKFYVEKGALFSFWFSPYITGESLGFTAGGGPALHWSGRDLPPDKD
ncbi:hypothetical protein C7S20_18825 [Christiangramia fulva]|uniref:Glycosyl hydrolase family 32 n=1 Tax=Christiangramia fulva TaxID=2126553 RepID=A0A2R3ZA21_9FLAO|nr:hypothetical protein [Christiangramia fulva]AVR47138.1 hypothetical protein C7S20_18825 [Christiangramia fulva]